MARDAQSFTIGDNTAGNNTKTDYIPLRGGGIGVYPVARVVFRGDATLNGSGVGDTADCRIKMPLPSDNVWQMDSFAVSVESTAGYDVNVFEMYVAPSTIEYGACTEIDFPLVKTANVDPGQTGNSVTSYAIGGQISNVSGGSIDTTLLFDDPYRIITFNDVSGMGDPTIWLSGGPTTNITGGTVRLVVSFLAYTFEQMNSSALWVGLNTRG